MSKFRTIAGSSAGNIVEWYDFGIYGFMAPYLARVFFPNTVHWLAILATFAVFAASFFARPVGAAIYGHFGDTVGRRNTLMWSIILMGVATFLIGILPSYHTAGILAPIILLVVRVFQGFSAGGEFGGSVTYLVESAPVLERGFFGGIAMAAAIFGMLLSALVATIASHVFSHQALLDWAWRVPFLIGIFFMLIGLYFRYLMKETPVFEGLKETNFTTTTPVRDTFSNNFIKILKVAATVSLGAVISYVVIVFASTYLTTNRHFDSTIVFLSSTISFLIVVVSCLLVGRYAVYVSRRRILLATSIALLVVAWPIGYTFQYGSLPEAMIAQFVGALIQGISFGALMAYLTELFPAVLRFTALSFGYNVGYAIFAGLSPMLATYLIHKLQAEYSFSIVLAIVAIISFVGLLSFKKPTVLFIPGLCFGRDLFKYQYSYFKDTFHCHSFIINSNKLEQNVESILKQIKAKEFSIAAHSSLGAGVALAVAAAAPERVKYVVCFPGWVAPNQYVKSFLKEALESISQGKFDEFKKTLRTVAVGEDVQSRSTVLNEIRKIQDEVDVNDGIQQCQLLMSELDITDSLPDVEATVLVVRNREGDPWFSEEEAIALSSSLKNGQSIIINNSGHIANYTSPREANTLIETWIRE